MRDRGEELERNQDACRRAEAGGADADGGVHRLLFGGDKWYMTYVVYNGKSGLDGRGYETWIAESEIGRASCRERV